MLAGRRGTRWRRPLAARSRWSITALWRRGTLRRRIIALRRRGTLWRSIVALWRRGTLRRSIGSLGRLLGSLLRGIG